MAKRVPLDLFCEKKILTLQNTYDGLIDYIDISSVDNIEKRIVSYQTIEAHEAPSRAKQLLKKNDIIVSMVRPNLNAVAVVEQEYDNLMVGSTGYCVLRCTENMDYRYLFHFCQSEYFIDDMSSQATGASYPAVNAGIVRSSVIPVYTIERQREIAKKLDADPKAVSNALDAIQDPLSLYEPVFHDGGETLFVMDQISDEKVLDETLIDSIALYDALKRLNEKERKIVSMRFFSEKTQMEVANEIGISQAQVSRLEKNAIEHMRKYI